jgi:hypothetical protein
MSHEFVHGSGLDDGTPLGTRVMVEKPEVENVDVANKFVVSPGMCRSDRVPRIVVVDSTGHNCNSEDYSYCHGNRRGDPS